MVSTELALGLTLAFVMLGIMMGLPIYAVFGLGGLSLLFITRAVDPSFAIPTGLMFMRSYTLLALPVYILLGKMMEAGVLTDRLLDFLRAVLGKSKAVFGGQTVVFCTLFGAISGSASATCGALGSILIPRAEENGYSREYMTSLIVCSSLIAMLIPPSILMIIFAFTAELSIVICFLTTAVPGLILTALYLAVNFFMTRKIVVPPSPPSAGKGKEIIRATRRGWQVLMLPVIILGGIYGGIFTPTEAAAVAVVWVILDGFVFHREFIPHFKGGLVSAGKIIGAIAASFFFAFILVKLLIWLNFHDFLVSFATGVTQDPIVFLIVINVLIIVLGMFVSDIAICLIAGILLVPIAAEFGIDPYHFAAIVGVNAGMANMTPPVAPVLYFGARIGEVPPEKTFKTVAIFILFGHFPVLMLVTYIPQLSLWLPNLWMAATRGG